MTKLDWAKTELEFAGYPANDPEDGPNKWLREGTLELLEVFSTQGHSGSSAPFALNLFSKLAAYKPLTPLTGNDSEWMEVSDDGICQNVRDGSVFRGADGQAYWLDGVVFWEWHSADDMYDGEPFKTYFTSIDSHVNIEFPWCQPESSEYKFRPSDEYPNEQLTQVGE
jgi:hypothetical protein